MLNELSEILFDCNYFIPDKYFVLITFLMFLQALMDKRDIYIDRSDENMDLSQKKSRLCAVLEHHENEGKKKITLYQQLYVSVTC